MMNWMRSIYTYYRNFILFIMLSHLLSRLYVGTYLPSIHIAGCGLPPGPGSALKKFIKTTPRKYVFYELF